MFKPIRAPKEGRSPPGLLYTGAVASPRRFSPRQATIALIILACFLMGYYVFNSDQTALGSTAAYSSQRESSTEYGSGSGGRRRIKDEGPSRDSHNEPADVPEAQVGKAKPHVNDVYENAEEENKRLSDSKKGSPKGSSPSGGKGSKADVTPETWSERASFEKKLQHVIDLLPNELNTRELIRPVDGTGKEKLREIGLRTKAYKTYFEAWEALHLSTDEDGASYIRDDVIQYLRSHQRSGEGEDPSVFSTSTLPQNIRAYESYRAFLNKMAGLLFPWTAPYFPDHMSLHAHYKKGGRGIVLTAGDAQAPYLLTTIYTFRKLGCNLPIEVMYLGDQDLGEDYRAELEALDGVVTRDIAQMVNDEGWRLAGWAAKPFAILLCSFREVIFIDADSLFFRNPALLFEDPDYQKTGALFFRDRLIMPESKKRWLQQILPTPISKQAKQSRFWTGESGHMQESGVIVVDKWKHFIPLLLVTRMNGPDRDGNKDQGRIGVYDMVYGDKETFWLGWLLAGDEDYAFHAGDAGIMGVVKPRKTEEKKEGEQPSPENPENPQNPEDVQKTLDQAMNQIEEGAPTNYTICAPQLLHLDLQGKPFWFNGWLLHNKFADKSKKKFAKFESYLIEPRHIRDPGAWQLAESNMCCLTSDVDKKFDFDEFDRKTLEMIMERASEVGMGDQH